MGNGMSAKYHDTEFDHMHHENSRVIAARLLPFILDALRRERQAPRLTRREIMRREREGVEV